MKNKNMHDNSYTSPCHQIPVCAGFINVSFDCATATTFAIFTDGAVDAFRDDAPVSMKHVSEQSKSG